MALYNIYRPKTFEEVVGQDHIIPILQQSAKENAFSHAYLLVGPRGTGKTTTARLIAQALGSQSLDLIEIDAASNTGVDEIRDLIEKAQFAPSMSPVKTYIIDEVHMLSKQAFNALLKTLEEPPSHTYFILATTEIQKVPVTIISRCQRFDFHRIEKKVIIDRLEYIAKKEGIEFELDALIAIAKSSDGGMRDAINIFEQVIFDNAVTYERAEQCLGFVRTTTIQSFIQLLLNKKTYQAIQLSEQLYHQGVDIAQFVKEILVTIRHIILDETDTLNSYHTDLLSMANELMKKDLKNSFYPLFEFQLFIYHFTFDHSSHSSSDSPIQKTTDSPVSINDDVYITKDIDMNAVGIPTLEMVKEKIRDVASALPLTHLRIPLKQSRIKSIEGNILTLEVSSSMYYEKFNHSDVIEIIQNTFNTILQTHFTLKIENAHIEVQEKNNPSLADDALRIFGNNE